MAATLQLQSSFDTSTSRPGSHQGLTTLSPSESPQMHRPSSQASLHLPPGQAHGAIPSPAPLAYEPLSAQTHGYPYLQYKPHPHAHYAPPTGITISSPQLQSYVPGYPSSAHMAFYSGSMQMYDPRSASVATPLMRTVSHAHPLTSANDLTASSRYSSSPHSPNAQALDGPASASVPPSYQWQAASTPTLSVQEPQERHSHINPSVFASSHSHAHDVGYAMSRSTSGASDAAEAQRLLTPHYEYREQYSPAAADLRKVSDQLGGHAYVVRGQTADRYTPVPGTAPYAQPASAGQYWGRETSTDPGYLPFSAHRASPGAQQQHHDMPIIPETEYERQRMQNVNDNKKIFETLGLGAGAQPFMRPSRQMSTSDLRSRKASKRRAVEHGDPVRSSPRIASQHRNVSYMDLDDGGGGEGSDDSYSGEELYEEDDFRPSKRGRGNRHMVRKASTYDRPRKMLDLSLWGLLQVYPQIPDIFPLFYYTLNNDLSINSDSVPLIGSIPSTITPLEKANILRAYFHRGRRVLSQLDNFTSRCDRKYEGPEERWVELEHNIRIAIRDVRRKIVERCENYKYTRRDILDKNVGKHKWQAIEVGMIEWRYGQTTGDPAGDLGNVTLTLPTPPPSVLMQQQQQQQQQQMQQMASQQEQELEPDYPTQRAIRPMPSRHRLVSAAPRSVSIVMAEPTSAMAPAPSGQMYPGTTMSVPTYPGGHYSTSPIPTSAAYVSATVPTTAHLPISAGMVSAALPTGVQTSEPTQYQQQLQYHQTSSSPAEAGSELGVVEVVPAWTAGAESGGEMKRELSVDSGFESEEN